MKKKTLLTFLSALLLLPLTFIDTADAQWAVGASYEVRDEDPTNGFGVRIERGILSSVPVVDLGLRAHFSYFNETNSLSTDGEATIDGTFESYDFGLAATGGVSVGLVKPYIGLGIGMDNSSLDYDTDINETPDMDPFDTGDIYYNGFAGAEITILPMLSPFIEYRFTKITGREDLDLDLDSVSRFAIGVSLRF